MLEKNEVRTRVRAWHGAHSDEWRQTQSTRAQKRLIEIEEFERAQYVGCYLGWGFELDTTVVIDAAFKAGKRVAAPKFFETTACWEHVAIRGPEDVLMGQWGVPEPASNQVLERDQLDIIVVPGMAFDGMGNRVGRGKGHYDGILQGYSGVSVGLAFGYQLFDQLPAEPHDIRLNIIVSPERVCRAPKNT